MHAIYRVVLVSTGLFSEQGFFSSATTPTSANLTYTCSWYNFVIFSVVRTNDAVVSILNISCNSTKQVSFLVPATNYTVIGGGKLMCSVHHFMTGVLSCQFFAFYRIRWNNHMCMSIASCSYHSLHSFLYARNPNHKINVKGVMQITGHQCCLITLATNITNKLLPAIEKSTSYRMNLPVHAWFQHACCHIRLISEVCILFIRYSSTWSLNIQNRYVYNYAHELVWLNPVETPGSPNLIFMM
jgi:hypothetical protein